MQIFLSIFVSFVFALKARLQVLNNQLQTFEFCQIKLA